LILIALYLLAGLAIRMKFGVPEESFKPRTGKTDWPAAAPDPDTFLTSPEDNAFEQRRDRFLRYAASRDSTSMTGAVVAARLGLSARVSDASLDENIKIINEREDCADFNILETVRVLYENAQHPILSPVQYARLKKAALGFKFWVDEPGENRMIFWTENHQIMFNMNEYLMGALFPDETFTNDGRKGRLHREHAERLIRKWIDSHARRGFSEWESNVYYSEDLAAVLTLADYAQDKTMARQAIMMADLILFDIAEDLFRGSYTVSHGRAYTAESTSGRDDNIRGAANLVWGYAVPGPFGPCDYALALSTRYRPPNAIMNAGRALPDEFIGYERHGIPLKDAPSYGLEFDNPDNIVTFWTMGAFTQPQVIVPTLKAFRNWHLWNHPFTAEVPAFVKHLQPYGYISVLARLLTLEPNRALLGEVNKVTYRTPDYSLSSAQDYRPGEPGNQQRVWMAALSPDAVVFTSNPGSPDASGDRTPTYWTGDNRFPRVAQYKNALIAIYKLDNYTIVGQRHFYAFTHAFFPRWAFDRVENEGNWTFGEAGKAYIALYSSTKPVWTKSGRDAGVELVANGDRNIWVCLLGRSEVDGSFDKFMADTLAATLKTRGLRITFNAPGLGKLKFGWKGGFTVDGRKMPLDGFKRFDNPFCQADFNETRFIIESGGCSLSLNFEKNYREVND
jgi:hypothetical protein